MWGVKSKVWSVTCKVSGVECKVSDIKCFKMCKEWSVKSGV